MQGEETMAVQKCGAKRSVMSVYVCECVCVFIELHLTAQSGPVTSSALCYLD